MDALVTDAHIPSAVAAIRALGRAGIRTTALAPERFAAGRWSRYADHRALGPDSTSDPVGFAAAVAELAGRRGPLLVYPGQEEALSALLADDHARSPCVRMPYPGEASLAPLRDKRCLPALAARVGLRTPSTLAAGRADEVLRGRLPERCVIKPTAISGELGGVRVADSVEELRTLLAALPPAEEVLLQERLSGTLAALSVVIDRGGSVVRRFQQRTLRTWPPEIGVSSLAVGVVSDEELTNRVRALLAETGFWGMAQLQFLEQPDGPRLIDVNPRIYGSLALALASGVNLPAAWHAVALGHSIEAAAPYRVGVTYRWLEADAMSGLRGDLGRLLARAPRPVTGPVWARDDLRGSVVLAADAVRVGARRRLRGLHRRAR